MMNTSVGDRATARLRLLAIAGLLLGSLVLTAAPAAQGNPGNQGPGNQGQQGGGFFRVDPDDPNWLFLNVSENKGIPLEEFIKIAQGLTGKNFVFTKTDFDNIPDKEIRFVGVKRLRKENFFPFFQTMLYVKGLATLIRGADDTEIIEIVYMAGPKRGELSSSARYVPHEDLVQYGNQTGVTVLTSVPLTFIDANAAQNSLRPFFVSSGAAGTQPVLFGSVGNAKALLMQGFGPQVFAAYQLLRLVDVEPEIAELDTRIVRLVEASAEETVQYVEEILNDRNRQQVQQAQQGASGAAVAATGPLQMKVMPHTSLNAIVLSGTKDQLNEAAELIARLDVPVDVVSGDTAIVRLKNVLAEDLEQVLDDFIREDIQAEQNAQQGGSGQTAQPRRPRRTVVVAHAESNSLLVAGTATKVKQIGRIIDELDRRQRQVLIECAVVELATTDLDSIGVELGLLDIKDNGDYTRPFGFTSAGLSSFEDTDDDGLPDIRLPDFENPPQGFTGGIISGGDFAIPVLVNALSQNDRANILSLPSVVVNNNETAIVKSEEERPTQTNTQNANTSQQGAGDPVSAGIELEISPSISTNDYLRLNINLRVSRFITAFNPNAVTAGVKTIREVRTQVTMPSSHTMILGGVIEDQESESDSGVPFLKDLPIIGFLFKTHTQDRRKTNLYFFLTPHILGEADFSDLAEISFRKKLEAADYIGHRRIQLVDRKWREGRPETLEDPGATIEDLDARGGFEIPYYQRPASDTEKRGASSAPSSPDASKPETTTIKKGAGGAVNGKR